MAVTVSKVISTNYTEGSRNRVVKILCRGALVNGRGDTKDVKESGPFGMDSNPTNGKVALFQRSEVYGKYYVIGYLNTQQKSEVGEARLFATDANGTFKFNIWIRNDGAVLIGDSDDPASFVDFAVKYNNLKLEYDKTKVYLTTLRSATQAALVSVDAVVPGTSAAFITAMGSLAPGDIESSKHEQVKYT